MSVPRLGQYLVVEDDRAFARTIARQLRRHGKVSVAHTASEAVALLRKRRRYSGFVLDVGLPDGSGLEILRQIRESGVDTPALVLTALEGMDVIATAQRHSATFLRKPAHADNLLAFVEQTRSHDRIVQIRLRATVALFARRHGLTPGQETVLLAAASGVLRGELASSLGVHESSVKTHVHRILQRTKARTLPAVVARVHRELFRQAS